MELVILIGLQASGKSTFARGRFGATHHYISRDLLQGKNNPARKQHQLIEAALQQGQSVVVDNTNPTPEVRKELIELGRLYGAEITGYYFAVQVEQSLARNSTREGKARVPNVAIFATLKRLTHPSYTEGFAKLFYVRNEGEQGFAVDNWSSTSL